MTKSFFLASAAILAMGSAALAQPGGDRDRPQTRAEVTTSVDARFARMDTNSDGVFNGTDRAAKQAERFAALDSDGNGELTEAELKAGFEARRAKMQERRAARRANRSEPTAEQAARRAERQEKRAERRERRAGNREERQEQRFAARDSDGNGSLSAAEWTTRPERADRAQAQRRGRNHRGMGMKMADANSDGAVSIEEMRNVALARFDKVDTDGDGTISAAERQAAREARKARRGQKQAG